MQHSEQQWKWQAKTNPSKDTEWFQQVFVAVALRAVGSRVRAGVLLWCCATETSLKAGGWGGDRQSPGFTSSPFSAEVFISDAVCMHCSGRLLGEKEADNQLSSLRWEKQIESDQRRKLVGCCFGGQRYDQDPHWAKVVHFTCWQSTGCYRWPGGRLWPAPWVNRSCYKLLYCPLQVKWLLLSLSPDRHVEAVFWCILCSPFQLIPCPQLKK